ncbi:uncharacterized protein LOC108330483 [Vigna angularis]|uniref:uncharacterized protein LOC108330483 n=1 Tax=Phaseolus angularis TaxID=3914 RepID=UPI0022B5C787|nr:uncharacterized protein LOC108330483 [Vigna angularis]
MGYDLYNPISLGKYSFLVFLLTNRNVLGLLTAGVIVEVDFHVVPRLPATSVMREKRENISWSTFEPATTTLVGYSPPLDVVVFPPSNVVVVSSVSVVFHPARQFELWVAAAPVLADEPKTASSSLWPSQPRARFEYRFLPPASFPVSDPCGGHRSIAGVSLECPRTLSSGSKDKISEDFSQMFCTTRSTTLQVQHLHTPSQPNL